MESQTSYIMRMVLMFPILLMVLGAVFTVTYLLVRSRRRPPPAFAVIVNEGPGRFTVTGVDRNTRADVRREIEADSAANAQVKAELDGIVVTSITRATPQTIINRA